MKFGSTCWLLCSSSIFSNNSTFSDIWSTKLFLSVGSLLKSKSHFLFWFLSTIIFHSLCKTVWSLPDLQKRVSWGGLFSFIKGMIFLPSIILSLGIDAPAAAANVLKISFWCIGWSKIVPGFISVGHFAMNGMCNPPSKWFNFQPR